MNRLLTFAGQQPIYLGDLDFLQDATKNSLMCLARALMNEGSDTLNAILQGVEISQNANYIQWTDGVVVLNGEILPISAGSVRGTLAQTPLYFHIEVAEDGSRTFKDGVSRSCWAIRTATIKAESIGSVAYVDDVQRLHVPYEDVVFEGSSASENITSAKLVNKRGFWCIDAHVSLPSGSYTLIGSISFSLPDVVVTALDGKSFYLPLTLEQETGRVTEEGSNITVNVHSVKVALAKVANNMLNVNVSFGSTASVTTGGNGDLQNILPIF